MGSCAVAKGRARSRRMGGATSLAAAERSSAPPPKGAGELFKLVCQEFGFHLIQEASPLQSVGSQKCLGFSTDGVSLLLNRFSTSTDRSARIWKIDEWAPLVNLTRSLVQMRRLSVATFLEI
ncbi:hypothetical protein ACP70R_003942 [Stipagrostis hirtigluma subsp. patula]